MNTIIIPLDIGVNLLWATFGLLLFIFAIISGVFLYHWQYYGIKGNHRLFAKSLYFFISAVILLAMFGLAYYYSIPLI